MATSRTFNLTAELNLRGPTNIGPIISNLKNQLSNISANVTVNVAPNAATNVAGLNTRLTALNATLVTTRTNTQAAAAAIQAFATAVNNINVGNVPQQITAVNNAINTLGNNNVQAARQIRQTGTEMEEFGRQAGLAIRRFAAFSVVGAGVMTFSRSLDQGVKAFIEYDKQLVKLQQVTGQTAVGLRTLTREITELSTNLGVSSSELTEVASTLAQAGLSARDTEKALKALALSSLAPSFDNMNETVEGSIALMRQFDISAGDLEKALSSINEVSAKFAVEASDIVTAIQRTGGVFATASKGVATGTEALNQFIAVFTSVRATTRESAETIATGLRTIFSRVQRGDTIEALKEYGVNLTDLDGKFVGAYRAVELLSQGLSRIDPRELRFSQITEELGGFRQIGKVIPLIQQFAVAQEALRTAEKGQDSLARDAATAQLSLANQISKVREQFLALFREIGGSNTFQTITRGALSLAGAMIRIADSMKEVLPVLGIMFAFRGASAVAQFGSGFLGAVRGNQRRANGGYIQAYAGGGTVNAMLMPGEAVIAPNVAARIGKNKLDKLNHAEKYAGGGGVKFVPGSGSTDSFGPIPLEVGSYVLRKNAVKAMGKERVSGLAKYADGGPVTIAHTVLNRAIKTGGGLYNIYDINNKDNNKKIINDRYIKPKIVDDKNILGSREDYQAMSKSIFKKARKSFFNENNEQQGVKAANDTIRSSLPREYANFGRNFGIGEIISNTGVTGQNKIAGILAEIDFQKKFPKAKKIPDMRGMDFKIGKDLYEVKTRIEELSDEEIIAKALLYDSAGQSKKNRHVDIIDLLSKYVLHKVEASKKFADGGSVENEYDKIWLSNIKYLQSKDSFDIYAKSFGITSDKNIDALYPSIPAAFRRAFKEAQNKWGLPAPISENPSKQILDSSSISALAEEPISDTPEDSMRSYKQSSRYLNQYILSGKLKDPKIDHQIKNLDSLMKSSSRYPIVYSGVAVSAPRTPFLMKNIADPKSFYAPEELNTIIGKQFSLPAYLSTSRDFEIAQAFSERKRYSGRPSAIFRIITKAGGKALDIDDELGKLAVARGESPFSTPLSGEYETILPRSSSFRVIGASSRPGKDKDPNKLTYHIDVQQLAKGGMVQRSVGYLDTDIIRDPANSQIVEPAMAALGISRKSAYKMKLSEMAAEARRNKVLNSYKVLAGVAGTGKSTLATARGKEKTEGTLRSTTRFPILTPEDIKRATEVIDTTSTASEDKLKIFKGADKIIALSTSTQEEQKFAASRRSIRDVTGVNQYGRKAGSTREAPLDSGLMEASLITALGSKTKIISAINRKRKTGSQIPSITEELIDLYYGSFSPMQKGHEARARMTKEEGPGRLPYVMIGSNESINRRDIGDTHSARTLVFPQEFRTQIARAALSNEGISVMPKAYEGFSIPDIFELEASTSGQRKFIRPKKGSIAHTTDKKTESVSRKYENVGFLLKNIEGRIGGYSGTEAREAILSGNIDAAKEMLSPAVFDVVNRNLIPLQNRANIAPKILANYGRRLDTALEAINAELGQLPQRLTKEKMKDPVFFAQAQRVLELRKKRDRLTGNTFAPHRTMERLAKRYPEYYGLETGLAAKSLLGQMPEENINEWINEFFPQAEAQSIAVTKAESSDLIARYRGASIPENIFSIDPTAWDKRKQINRTINADVIRSVNRASYSELMSPNKVRAFSMLRDWMISGLGESGGTEAAQQNNDRLRSIEDIKKTKKLAIVGIDPLDFSKTEGPMKLGDENVTIFMRGMPGKYKDVINKLRAGYESITSGAAEEILSLQGGGRKTRNLSEAEKMAAGKAGAEGGMLEALLGKLGARGGTVQNRAIDYPFGLGAAAAAFPGIGANWPTEAKRTLSAKNIADAKEEFVRFFGENNKESEAKKIKKMAFGGEVPIMAQEGEYVINRASAQQIGYSNLDRLNKYHTGGMVSTRKFASGGQVSGDAGVQQQAINLINSSQINNLRLWSGLFSDLSNNFITNTATITNAGDAMIGFNQRVRQLENDSYGAQIPMSRLIQAMRRDLNDALASGTVSADRIAEAHDALTNVMDTEATALQQLSGRRQAQTRQVTGNISQRINETPYLGAGVRGLSRMGSAVNGQAGYFLGMGVSMIGTQAENMFGKRDTNAATAGRVAQVEGITGTAGAGLSLAGGLAGIPGIGPFAAGVAVAGTAIYSLADYMTDFTGTVKNATNEFEAGVRAKDIAKATTDVEKAMEALQKDFNNPVLREEVNKASKARTELATADFRKNVTAVSERMNPKGFFRGITGQEAAPLTEEKINKIAQEISTSDASRQNESMARQTIEMKIQQGMSLNNISDGGEWLKLTEQILQTDAEFVKLVRSGDRVAVSNRITAKAVELLEDPALRAAEKAKQLSDAMDAADKAGRRLAFSLERVAESITQSMDAAMFNFEKSLSMRSGITDSLSGKASIREVKSESINILKNPKAYSEKEFGGALQEAVNLNSSIGGDPRVSSMITGSASLGRSISDITQKAVRVAAGGKASLSLDEAKRLALEEGKKEIKQEGKRLGLSDTAQEDLVAQLKGRLDKAGKDAKKDDKGNIDVDAFDEELKQLGDSIGQRGKEIAISILEFKDNAINKFIGAMNEGTKHLIEADRYRAKAMEIGVKGGFDMRQTTRGVAPSFDELSSVRNAKIAQLTGGLTDPTAIANRKNQLARAKEFLQKGLAQAGKDNNIAGVEQLAKQIQQMDASINQADEALKELANNTDLAAAALDEMKTVIELQKQTIDSTKKVLSTGPKELKQQFDAMARVRFMMAGGTVTNTRQAQRAFTDTLRSTGDRRQAEIARQDVLAQQRAEEQQAFERMKPMAELQMRNRGMTSAQIDQQMRRAEANMMTAQGRAAGINTNNESNMILNPENASPAGIAAQQKFAAANGVQIQANMELSKEEQMMASLSDATQQLTKAFIEAADRMRRAFGIDQQVENPLNMPAIAAPVAPQGKARGGVIYASRGTLVNYEPQGTDTVPAMLTPGEFVVNARATAQHLPLLQALNRSSGGEIPSGAVFGKFVTMNIGSSKSKIDPRGRSSYMSDGGVVYLQRGGRSYRNRGNEPYVGIAGQQEFIQAYQSQIPRYNPQMLMPRASLQDLFGSSNNSNPPQEGGIFANARRQNQKFLREKEEAKRQKMQEAANAPFPLLPFINNTQAVSGLLGLSNTLSQIPSAIPSLIGSMDFSKKQQPVAPVVPPKETPKNKSNTGPGFLANYGRYFSELSSNIYAGTLKPFEAPKPSTQPKPRQLKMTKAEYDKLFTQSSNTSLPTEISKLKPRPTDIFSRFADWAVSKASGSNNLALGGIVSPARYSSGGHVRASASMINNGVSSNRSVNISEQLDPIYKALGGLLENHASAFGGQIGSLNGVADRFQQAFGMVSGGIAVNHNLTAQHNHSGHLNTLQQNIEDKTAGLVSNVIGTMRRSSDGGLDQMLGMDSNQIIGKSKYT